MERLPRYDEWKLASPPHYETDDEMAASDTELRKQISLFVPLSDYRVIRDEAARQRIPMTQLIRKWMKPSLKRLK